MPIYEPHLEEMIARARHSGHLAFTTDVAAAVGTHIAFICVNTPPLTSGEADLSCVEAGHPPRGGTRHRRPVEARG